MKYSIKPSAKQDLTPPASFFRRISESGINWALFDQAIVSGSNFVLTIVLARYMGLDAFGVFAIVWASILFANAVQLAVIISPMISLAPKVSQEDVKSFYGSMFLMQALLIVSAIMLTFFANIMSGIFFPDLDWSFLLLPIVVVLFSFLLQDFMRRLFFSRKNLREAFFIDCISYLGQLLAVGTLIYFEVEFKVENILYVLGATFFIGAFVGFILNERVSFSRNLFSTHVVKVFHFSKWLFPSAVFQWLSANIFIFILGGALGAWAAGAFRAIQSILGITHILFQGLENIVFPKASKVLQNLSTHGLNEYLIKVSKYGFYATLGLVVPLILCSPVIFDNFFGNEYLPYAPLLKWMAIGYLIFYFFLPLHAGLRVLEKTKLIFISQGLTMAAAIFSAIVFIPLEGLFGGVMGWVFSRFVLVGLMFFYYKREATGEKQ